MPGFGTCKPRVMDLTWSLSRVRTWKSENLKTRKTWKAPQGHTKGTPRAFKRNQGQAIASSYRRNPCILHLHFPKTSTFSMLSVKVASFSECWSGLFPQKRGHFRKVNSFSGFGSSGFGFSGFRVFRFRVFGFSGFRVFGISGFRVFGISGFRDFGFSGFRVFGFSGFRVFGFRVPNLDMSSRKCLWLVRCIFQVFHGITHVFV